MEVDLLVAVRRDLGGEEAGREDRDEEDEARDGQAVLKKAAVCPRPVAARFACELRLIQSAKRCRGQSFEVSYDVVPARTSTGISDVKRAAQLGLRPMAEPTREDIDALVGPATPHFAPQLRARIEELVLQLPEGHPVKRYAREKIALLEQLAFASSKADEGPREPRSRPGWDEIPSTAPAHEPLPGRK